MQFFLRNVWILAALAVGCGELLGVDDLRFDGSGGTETAGGSAGTTSTGGTSGTFGGMAGSGNSRMAGSDAGGASGREGGAGDAGRTGQGGAGEGGAGEGGGGDGTGGSGGAGDGGEEQGGTTSGGSGAGLGGSGGAGPGGSTGMGGAGAGGAGAGGAGGMSGNAGAGGGAGLLSVVHVATSGTNHEACGAQSSPCRTIEFADTRLLAGGTITLGAGLFDENPIVFYKDVTVLGAGIGTTTIRGDDSTFMTLLVDMPYSLVIRRLSMLGPGMAAYANPGASLTLEDVDVAGVSGPTGTIVVGSGGPLTLRRTRIVDCQAIAIGNANPLLIEDSFIGYNTAPQPAVLVAYPNAVIRRSAFIGNTGPTDGTAALHVNSGGTAFVENSTFATNTGSWFAIAVGGTGVLTMRYSTVANNTVLGAVSVYGSASFEGTLFSNNGSFNCGNAYGNLVSNGHNLSSDGTCEFFGASDLSSTNPLLSPLADNGGFTPTLAPGFTSPAVDGAGTAGCPATDQRGVSRPQTVSSAACDIGAYEREP